MYAKMTAAELRSALYTLDFTQRDLAELLSYSLSQINAMCRDRTEVPTSVDFIVRLLVLHPKLRDLIIGWHIEQTTGEPNVAQAEFMNMISQGEHAAELLKAKDDQIRSVRDEVSNLNDQNALLNKELRRLRRDQKRAMALIEALIEEGVVDPAQDCPELFPKPKTEPTVEGVH
jgi:hypothetical protein